MRVCTNARVAKAAATRVAERLTLEVEPCHEETLILLAELAAAVMYLAQRELDRETAR